MAVEAFGNGSDDNISVAIIEFGEVPRELIVGTMPLEYEVTETGAHAAEHESSNLALTLDTVRIISATVAFVLFLIGYFGRG